MQCHNFVHVYFIDDMKVVTYIVICEKVRDELEQLLEDDDDMANLYLSRKLALATGASEVSDTGRGDETDVEELEMLLEV